MHKQRRTVMIKNEFQQSLILSTLLITLITLNVIIMAAFLLEEIFGTEDSVISVFSVSIAIMELVAVVVVYYVGRRISFHIAGPIYAMERTLNAMAEGELGQQLKLRRGDQFPDVADALNNVIVTYRERLSIAQALVEDPQRVNREDVAQLREALRWFDTEWQVAAAQAAAESTIEDVAESENDDPAAS